MARRLLGFFLLGTAMLGCNVLDGSRVFGRRDYAIDPSARFQKTDLAALMSAPNAVTDVDFTGIFRQHNEVVWQPFYTPFVPEDFASFSMWPMNARLWEVAGRANYLPTIFINKEYNPHFKAYLQLKKYDIVRVRGTVRSDFQNRPWIEVIYIERTGGPAYDDETLANLVAGIHDAEKKRVATAVNHLNRAIDGTLPDHGLAVAYAKLGWAYETRARMTKSADDWSAALDGYETALSYDAANSEAMSGAARAEKALDHLSEGLDVMEPDSGTKEPSEAPEKQPAAEEHSKAVQATKAALARAEAAAKTAEEARVAAEARASEAALRAESAAKESEELKNRASAAEAEKVRILAEAAEAAAKVAAAAEAKDRVEKELSDLRKRLEQGDDASKILSARVAELEAEAASAKQKAADAEAARAKLETELAEARRMLAAGSGETKDLMEKIADLETEVAASKKTLETANGARAKLEAEVADLQKRLEAGKADAALADKIADLETELAAAKKTLELANAARARVEAERDEWKKKAEAAPTGAPSAELAEKIEDLESELAATKKTLEMSSASRSKIEAERDELLKKAAAAEEQIKTLTAQRDEWKKKAEAAPTGAPSAELTEKIEDLESELAAAKKTLELANAARAKVEAERDELKKKAAAAEEQIKALTAERDQLAKEKAAHQCASGDVEQLKKDLAAKDEEIGSLKSTKETQAVIIKDLRVRVEELEKENDELRQQLEDK